MLFAATAVVSYNNNDKLTGSSTVHGVSAKMHHFCFFYNFRRITIVAATDITG